MAVDDPFVTVSDRASFEKCGIGTGAGFGHRETAAKTSFEQRVQPLVFLGLARRTERNQLCVARVGRIVAKHRGCVPALAEYLVKQAKLDLTPSPTSQFRFKMRRPHALRFHLFLQRFHDRLEHRVRELVGDPFDRNDLLLDERLRPVKFRLELWFGRKIPCHVDPFSPARGDGQREPDPTVQAARFRTGPADVDVLPQPVLTLWSSTGRCGLKTAPWRATRPRLRPQRHRKGAVSFPAATFGSGCFEVDPTLRTELLAYDFFRVSDRPGQAPHVPPW